VCRWVEENTRPGDCFLTPRGQQTFKWRAGRAEVATWKDIPQEAGAVVQWWRRLRELSLAAADPSGLAGSGVEPLAELARKYGAQYVIVDRTRTFGPLGMRRIYPFVSELNPTYEVYRTASAPTANDGQPGVR
jgi:hypothetical protein